MLTVLPNMSSDPAGGPSIASYRDHARPLLVFAPSTGNVRLQKQVGLLRRETAGLAERQVVTLLVVPGGGSPAEAKAAVNSQPLSDVQQQGLVAGMQSPRVSLW